MNCLLTFVVTVVCAAVSTIAAADAGRTIYYNGKVFTSSEQHLRAEGLVVEDGLILAVGTSTEVRRFEQSGARLVDLHGKTVIPGFNDAHVHPFDHTAFPRAAHLNQASDFVPGPGPTLQDVLDLVRRGAASNPPGTWLFVSVGTNVVEDPHANRFALDAVSPDHPVLLGTWYGHGTFLNTRAMQVIGIGEQEPDPFGGSYERVSGSNVITGVAHEYAEHLIRKYFASQMTDAEFRSLYENFARGAAAAGYTSVQDISVGLPQQRHVAVLAQSVIPIRWRALCFPLTVDESCDTLPLASGNVRSSGIKWIADGTMIERAAFLTEDYADAPGVRGHLNFPAVSIEAALQRSATGPAEQTQALFHAVGDGTPDTILDRMGAVAPDGVWAARRPRIEHGTLLRPDRYASARNKGVFVVQNPLHFALAPFNQVRFSAGLLADIDPMSSLLNAGVKLALGSDSVIAPGNPFLDMFFALFQPSRRSEALTAEQFVIAYTRTSAEAEFQEQRKGTLEAGKLADFVVLSSDIFSATATPPDILGTRALLTVVGGDVVYDSGALASGAATSQPSAK